MKDVRTIFANSPIKFSQVVLEVTERDPIVNFTKTRQTIAALQGLGVRIATDRNSTTIVETLVDLARNMRIDVVAEGVENFEQGMHLRTLGVRLAQGYVFAPAATGELVPAARRSHRSLAGRGCGRDRAYQGVGLEALQKRKGAALRPPSYNATREEPRKGRLQTRRPT